MKTIPVLTSLKDTVSGSVVTRSLRNFNDSSVQVNENVLLSNTTEGVSRTAVVTADETNSSYCVFLLT